jgi:hypothetical protein
MLFDHRLKMGETLVVGGLFVWLLLCCMDIDFSFLFMYVCMYACTICKPVAAAICQMHRTLFCYRYQKNPNPRNYQRNISPGSFLNELYPRSTLTEHGDGP